MEVGGTGKRRVLKSLRHNVRIENGSGCDVGGFFCFWGVLRENQRGILEFGLELGGFKPDYIIFGVENQGAVRNKNTQSHIVM